MTHLPSELSIFKYGQLGESGELSSKVSPQKVLKKVKLFRKDYFENSQVLPGNIYLPEVRMDH